MVDELYSSRNECESRGMRRIRTAELSATAAMDPNMARQGGMNGESEAKRREDDERDVDHDRGAPL
jgi:hypothetical protein